MLSVISTVWEALSSRLGKYLLAGGAVLALGALLYVEHLRLTSSEANLKASQQAASDLQHRLSAAEVSLTQYTQKATQRAASVAQIKSQITSAPVSSDGPVAPVLSQTLSAINGVQNK